ncbi:MAG: hypothetical protein ACD_12C00029G0005 [uncultured bacterium]|nr:MAG: hypothetical protein ACD_12C00029G0005 [uncultured bacterium]
MKKLEERIIKNIYRIETEKTIRQIISKIILIIFIIFTSLFIFSIVVEILNEQASFDLFDFLRDDFEIIQNYFISNSLLFIQELPFPLIYILIGLLLLLIWVLYIVIKNSSIIKNKLILIYKFWFK